MLCVCLCAALANGDAESSLQQAQKVMKLVQELGDSELLSKLELVASLHSCIGNAYLEMGEAEKALHHHLQDLKTAEDKYDFCSPTHHTSHCCSVHRILTVRVLFSKM